MIKIWDKKTNLILPNGENLTAQEVMERFGFTKHCTAVIEKVGGTTMAIDNLDILVGNYKVDEALLNDPEAALSAVLAAREKLERETQNSAVSLEETVLVAALKAAFPQQDFDTGAVARAIKTAKAGDVK